MILYLIKLKEAEYLNNFDNKTRKNKFEKRRKNTKLISILLIVGGILLIVLIAIWLFGGKDNKPVETKNEPQNAEENIDNDAEKDNEDFQKAENNEKESEIANEQEDAVNNSGEKSNEDDDTDVNTEIEVESVEPSDDNVAKAYRGNWEPIGTNQSEPHTTVYAEESTDRNEIEQAIRIATGLDDMITWWLTNDGPEKTVATVSDRDQTQTYRVYLSWIENQGWQPTVVEELKVNDKKK